MELCCCLDFQILGLDSAALEQSIVMACTMVMNESFMTPEVQYFLGSGDACNCFVYLLCTLPISQLAEWLVLSYTSLVLYSSICKITHDYIPPTTHLSSSNGRSHIKVGKLASSRWHPRDSRRKSRLGPSHDGERKQRNASTKVFWVSRSPWRKAE